MVKQMDSNNDGKIEADDIKKFSKKHFISWDDTVNFALYIYIYFYYKCTFM